MAKYAEPVKALARRTGLKKKTIADLFENGWEFSMYIDKPDQFTKLYHYLDKD